MSTTTPVTRTPVPDGHAAGDGPRTPFRVGQQRRRVLAMAVAGALVLVLFATWLVVFSSAFGVHSVQVRGARSLTTAVVVGRADIARGTPLVRVDTAAATARIESLPEVASAEVSTSFPSTVVITITERTAVGYIATNGVFRLVDRTGDAYRAVASKPSGVPALVVSTAAAARQARRAVAHVAAALSSLPAAQRPQVRSIQALAPDAITVVLAHGKVVQWGSASRDADKARVLPIMLRRKSATQFDVSNPDRPYSNS